MGSLLKPKSTRARRGRSSRIRTTEPSISPAGGTVEREAQADAILAAARTTSAARGIPVVPPSPLAISLRDIRARLSVIRSVAFTATAALQGQLADHDADVSLTLRRCVGDELDRQIERIDNLIGGVAP